MPYFDDGWTLGDLAGELHARGIDIDDVPSGEIEKYIYLDRPEDAAKGIEADMIGTPDYWL